jgi:hypothetical protein
VENKYCHYSARSHTPSLGCNTAVFSRPWWVTMRGKTIETPKLNGLRI